MTLVAGQEPNDRGKARRLRNGVAIAVSLLAHAVIFTIAGFNAPRLIAPNLAPLEPVNVWIMPRLTLQAHKPAEHKAVTRAPALSSKPKTLHPPVAKPQPVNPEPAPRATAATPAPGAPGGAKGPLANPVGVEGAQGGVREALRTSVGCDFDKTVHLTPAEKDRCNQHYGELAKKQGAFSGLDPIKRGRFDDQAAADERRRANRTGPMQELMVPCTGPGSNLGGDCLPDSAIAHLHQH